jgi:hypothetical protein
MEQPNKLNPASNMVMLQCKFVNEANLSAEKPDQASFATHLHFYSADKNNANFKRNIGERTR